MSTQNWSIQELEDWDKKVQEAAQKHGLSYFPIEFMLNDSHEMLSFMAYDGMPSHYPHWSFGKAYERTRTMYDHGVSGLPYEMVINANPALAYLMRDNTLCLQMITIAHVYGHVDFFTNNFYFKATRPEDTLATFKVHANRIRNYLKQSTIGNINVERILDSAHALRFNCNRNYSIKRLSQKAQVDRAIDLAKPREDPWALINPKQDFTEPQIHKVPIEPDDDLLLFIRDNNPFLAEWEKDILTIVWEEAQYFIPLMETKIMNEGWASYWHNKFMKELEPPEGVMIEYAMHNSHVVVNQPYNLNPYYIGMTMFQDIEKRFGKEAMFEARATERDTSFLRRFLTKELVMEMKLLEYGVSEDDESVYDVKRVADNDDKSWKAIRDKLVSTVGMNAIPVIKVEDSNFGQDHTLLLKHYHDGRDLFVDWATPTLRYIQSLWKRKVVLETILDGKGVLVTCNENGEVKAARK